MPIVKTKRKYTKRKARRNFMKFSRAPTRKPAGGLYHTFTRRCDYPNTTLTGSTADVWKSNGLSFKLNDLPNPTDFTNLFDSYRINWVKLTLTFQGGTTGLYDTYFNNMPLMFMAYTDYDDDSPPQSSLAGWQAVQEVAIAKRYTVSDKGRNTFNFLIRPRVAIATYQTGLTSGYSSVKNRWCDCEDDTIPHFGFKYIVRLIKALAAGAETTMTWTTEAQFNITCRYPR